MEVKISKFRTAWGVRWYVVSADGRKQLRKSLLCAKELKKNIEKQVSVSGREISPH